MEKGHALPGSANQRSWGKSPSAVLRSGRIPQYFCSRNDLLVENHAPRCSVRPGRRPNTPARASAPRTATVRGRSPGASIYHASTTDSRIAAVTPLPVGPPGGHEVTAVSAVKRAAVRAPDRFPLQVGLNAALAWLVLFGTGCASAGYRIPTPACINDYAGPAVTEIAQETRARALDHPAYSFIPFQRHQMHWYDPRHLTWYLFGNDADGIFGEGSSPEHPYRTNINCATWFKWDVMRNFGHNMFFYPPLGSACFHSHWNWSLLKADAKGVAAFARDRTGVFGEGSRSFKLNLNDLKPLIALKLGRFESYLGWRERGNLGASFRFHLKKKSVEKHTAPFSG